MLTGQGQEPEPSGQTTASAVFIRCSNHTRLGTLSEVDSATGQLGCASGMERCIKRTPCRSADAMYSGGRGRSGLDWLGKVYFPFADICQHCYENYEDAHVAGSTTRGTPFSRCAPTCIKVHHCLGKVRSWNDGPGCNKQIVAVRLGT